MEKQVYLNSNISFNKKLNYFEPKKMFMDYIQ